MTMGLGRMLKPLYDDPVSRDSGNSKGADTAPHQCCSAHDSLSNRGGRVASVVIVRESADCETRDFR